MKKLYFIYFLLFNAFPLFSFSQKLGEEISFQEKGSKILAVENNSNGSITVSSFKNDKEKVVFSVQSFDKNLKSYFCEHHTFSITGNQKRELIKVFKLGDTQYLATSFFDLSKKTNQLECYEINDKGINISSLKVLDEMPAFAINNCGNYRLAVSNENTRLAIIRENIVDKLKNESIHILSYDENLELLINKDHIFDIPGKSTPVNIPFINNSGDLFFIKKIRDRESYKYQIYCINALQKEIHSKPIHVSTVFISDIRAEIVKNGELLICGFYSTVNYTDYEGLFYFRFNSNGNVSHKFHQILGSDIRSLYVPKKDASKPGFGITGFSLQHIVPLDSGGVYLLAERSKSIMSGENENFQYEDILVIMIDHLGNIKWGKSIKKQQSSQNDKAKWNSYSYWNNHDTLYFVYNKMSSEPSLTQVGERKRVDEFGKFTFAGPIFVKMLPNGEITSNSMIKLFDSGKQKAINPEKMGFNLKTNKAFFISESFFGDYRSLVEINY